MLNLINVPLICVWVQGGQMTFSTSNKKLNLRVFTLTTLCYWQAQARFLSDDYKDIILQENHAKLEAMDREE